MRRAVLPLLATLALLPPASAQSPVTLGRLFATPAERATMDASRGARTTLLPNSQGVAPAPGMAGGPPATAAMAIDAGVPPALAAPGAAPVPGGAPAVPPSELIMTGTLRSSDNRSVVFLNGVPQPGLKAGQKVLVTMPSGQKILLKPGQRYDLNERRIKDVNEP
jgi:hypothetical protein